MRSLLILTSVAAWTLAAAGSGAHEVRPAVADVERDGGAIVITLDAALEAFIAGMDLSIVSNSDEAAEAEAYDALRAMPPAELEAALRAFWPTWAEGWRVTGGDAPAVLSVTRAVIPPVGDLALPRDSRLILRAEAADPVVVGWSTRFGALVVRQQGAGEDAYTGYLTDGALSEPMRWTAETPQQPPPALAAVAALAAAALAWIVLRRQRRT